MGNLHFIVDYISLCRANVQRKNSQWDDPFKFISAKHAINLLIFISFTPNQPNIEESIYTPMVEIARQEKKYLKET